MGVITKPTTFTDGTIPTAAQFNGDFDTIYNEFNGNISTANLADNAVTTSKISNDAVTSAKFADSAITTAKINDSAVTSRKFAPILQTAIRVANFSTTSTSFVDVTDCTVSVTPEVTSTLLIWFSGQIRRDALGGANVLEIIRGATSLIQQEWNAPAVSSFQSIALVTVDASLAAGTYTVKARIKDGTGQSLSVAQARLTVMIIGQ